MPVQQLTLYDFLADFVPGTLAVVLFMTSLSLMGIVPTPSTVGLGAGVIVIVLSYLVGRIVHAVAGQDAVKKFRELFDDFVFRLEDEQEPVERKSITEEPKFPEYVGGDVGDAGSFDEMIEAKLPELIANHFDELSEDDAFDSVRDREELRRFGYSILFGKNTMYHRYNILETFYRNLWLVSAISFPLLVVAGLDSDRLLVVGCGVGLLVLSVLFDIRRVQFKDRQVRALINDLYLHFAEKDE